MGRPCQCYGCCQSQVGTFWFAFPPNSAQLTEAQERAFGIRETWGPASTPPLEATGAENRSVNVGDRAEHGDHLRKDTTVTHPSAGEGLHIVSPLGLPVFGFPWWWWWAGPSLLIPQSPQHIHSLRGAAFLPQRRAQGLCLRWGLRRPLLAVLQDSSSSFSFPPPHFPSPLALVLLKVLEALSDPQRSSSPPALQRQLSPSSEALRKEGLAGRTRLFQLGRESCACAHESFRKLTHLTFPKMLSKLPSLGTFKAF